MIYQIFKFKLGQINARISQGLNISSLIIEIDNMIFDLYNLSKDEREEIGFIEIQ
jgi:hypothetical protein